MATAAAAQPAIDRLLSSATIVEDGRCQTVDIAFNRAIAPAGEFPYGAGTEISIRFNVLDTTQTAEAGEPLPEAATVPQGNQAGLLSASLDFSEPVPLLLLRFNHSVHFEIFRDSNSRHILVSTSDRDVNDGCGTSKTSTGQSDANNPIAEGKKSLAAKDYARAVALFTKAVSSGVVDVRKEGQELLGLSRERAGQLAHAKAEYEGYLKTYPSGDGADRVRQRLASVMAAIESDATAQFEAKKKAKLEGSGGPGVTPQDGGKSMTVTLKSDFGGGTADEKGWHWDTSGSAGQFYYRDDGFTGAGLLRGSLGTHDVNQNDIISSADITVHGENGPNEIKVRLAGYEQTDAKSPGLDGRTRLNSAYVDMRNRLNGISARIGRQTRSGGGVFGRFDGALLGMEINDIVTLQAVAGSPVYYGDTEPFADGRYFYGASIDLTAPGKVWSATLYAIEQDVKQVVDRRALGAELRYAKGNVTGYAAADYDVYFNEVNAAYVSGSWMPIEGLSIYGTIDYRHVPFLLTSNALMGQSAGSLSSLIELFGNNETEALATDRTASAATAAVGFSYDLSPAWQLAVDASIADYSGTPASGGVDEIPDPGTEYYISAQLNGTGILTDNDYVALGLSFMDTSAYSTYIADFNLRYPVTEKLRLNPRLRLAYRDRRDGGPNQILLMPSLGLKYRVTDHWNFESQVALRWEDNASGDGNGENAEVLMTIGYRYEF